jgi:hypothetical protein
LPNYHELIDVFEKAREFVLREGNDFSWSGWDDRDEALVEIHNILAAIGSGEVPTNARVLFLPTGPLQELSLSSGWGDEFIALASWFDEALSGVDCVCYADPLRGFGTSIGTDSRYADVSVTQCPVCGRSWLRYQYEFEFFSNSGRWFLGPLRRDMVEGVTAENAKELFEEMLWHFAGGSYYDGIIRKISGSLVI